MSVLGHELILGASLGISLFSEQAREISVLMSQANLAMQHAKQLGGNTFQFFRDNLQDSTLERLRLETRLRKAVEEGQLDVHYQPKLCLASGCADSVEALVRWHHPEEGMIPPSTFIGLAEVRVDRRDRRIRPAPGLPAGRRVEPAGPEPAGLGEPLGPPVAPGRPARRSALGAGRQPCRRRNWSWS